MATLRLVRNLYPLDGGLSHFLHYLTGTSSRVLPSVCLNCGRQDIPSRTYSTLYRNSLKSRVVTHLSTVRLSSTQSLNEELENSDPSRSPKSPRSPASKQPAYTVVDAENDKDYFKAISQQSKIPVSDENCIDWNHFVDPNEPLKKDDILKQQTPNDRFGKTENPLTYPKKAPISVKSDVQEEIENIDWKEVEKFDSEKLPFEILSENDSSLTEVGPALQPFSHNLAAYANVSDNIKKLIEMGVDVWKLDKDPEMSQRIMTAEWDNKIQPWIDWMKGMSLSDYDISVVLGKHPRILKENINNLNKIVNYFETKKFLREKIGEIFFRAPQTFCWNVRYVDKRLGELQKYFKLTGEEVREVVGKQPKLIVLPSHHWNVLRLALVNEMGFTVDEVKKMLIEKPKIFRQAKPTIIDRFDYLHNVCHFSHVMIVQFPEALLTRKFHVKERHLFLKSTKKNQYDPKKPQFVSLKNLVSGRDVDFCRDVAKVPVEVFNEFIKTL